jgi:hypothetical protein
MVPGSTCVTEPVNSIGSSLGTRFSASDVQPYLMPASVGKSNPESAGQKNRPKTGMKKQVGQMPGSRYSAPLS